MMHQVELLPQLINMHTISGLNLKTLEKCRMKAIWLHDRLLDSLVV